MAYPKQDPELKMRGICGGTTSGIIAIVKYEAASRKITVSKLVGEILDSWAEGKTVPEGVEWEYLRYRHWQTPKRMKETKEYKEGALGKLLRGKEYIK